MDFWFAIYISSCHLLILLLRFTQFQRCLNVPGCLMRHFPTSFFGRLPGGEGGNLYSQGTTTQLTFLLNYSWNIFIQISILQQIETAVLFICVFFNTCTLYRCSDFSNNGHTLHEQKATEAGRMWCLHSHITLHWPSTYFV